MQVRLNLLMKQQERLLRESEATVARRETIILRREAMAHSSHKQTSKGELKRITQGLQRRIQDTNKVGDVHFAFLHIPQARWSVTLHSECMSVACGGE